MVSHLVIQNLFQTDKTLKFHNTEGLYFLRGEGDSRQEERCLIMWIMNQTIMLPFYPVAIKMVDCQFHHLHLNFLSACTCLIIVWPVINLPALAPGG